MKRFALSFVFPIAALFLLSFIFALIISSPSLKNFIGSAFSYFGGREEGQEGVVNSLMIARLAIIPIFVWVTKNLFTYSFLRRHVTRAIYVDVEYRMRFAELFIKATQDWLSDYEPANSHVPFLRVGKEDHHMYGTIQSDLRECTWGEEVASVRLIYRTFDEVERAADRIRLAYNEILSFTRDAQPTVKRDVILDKRKRIRKQIEAEVKRLEEVFAFWVRVGNDTKTEFEKEFRYSKNSTWRFAWVARGLFYRREVWHSLCFYSPAFLLVSAGGVLLSIWVNLSGFLLSLFVMGASSLWLSYLYLNLRKREDQRISRIVVSEYNNLLGIFLSEKRPPIFI